MSLDALPNEIIAKIIEFLMDDPISFNRFTSSQKRFLIIANNLIFSNYWLKNRPSILVIQPTNFTNSYESTNMNDNNVKCCFGNLHNLFHCSLRYYSTIKFVGLSLEDNLPPNWSACNELAYTRICGIVELNLHNCDITSGWLITLIEHFINMKYLILDNTSLVIKDIDFNYKNSYGLKCLEELRIINHSRLFTDACFIYFYNNFSTKLLDLTNTKIVYHNRSTRRFYGHLGNNQDEAIINYPSEDIFSFEMIKLYLKKNNKSIKQLNLSQTDIQYSNMMEIIQNQDTKNLNLILLCCQYISQDTEDMLSGIVDDIGRVRFY